MKTPGSCEDPGPPPPGGGDRMAAVQLRMVVFRTVSSAFLELSVDISYNGFLSLGGEQAPFSALLARQA